MTRKTWKIGTQGETHTIELEHSYWTGNLTIQVDGSIAYKRRKFIDFGGRYPIKVAGHPCVVEVKTNGFTFSYNFKPNEVAAPPMPTPWWAWAFVVACILIPVVSLGGAIPGGLGAGGAAACYGVAGNDNWEAPTRIVACVIITLLCWILFLMLGALIAGGRRVAG
jgi:hypothetical protein